MPSSTPVSVPSLATLATLGPARSLAQRVQYRADRGDAAGAVVALRAHAWWLVDQQQRHASLAQVSLAANDNAFGPVAA